MISLNYIIETINKDHKLNVYYSERGKNRSENKINIGRIKKSLILNQNIDLKRNNKNY